MEKITSGLPSLYHYTFIPLIHPHPHPLKYNSNPNFHPPLPILSPHLYIFISISIYLYIYTKSQSIRFYYYFVFFFYYHFLSLFSILRADPLYYYLARVSIFSSFFTAIGGFLITLLQGDFDFVY